MVGKVKTVRDPVLGDLTRSRRLWRGAITMPDGSVTPLAIMGSRQAPDVGAVALAQSIERRFEVWRPAIEAALEAHASDLESTAGDIPLPAYAAVIAVDGHPTIELGYRVPWDDDHTLGAVIRDDRFIELNGSVLEP